MMILYINLEEKMKSAALRTRNNKKGLEAIKTMEANHPTTPKPPSSSVKELMRALQLIPNPQPKIRLKIQDAEALKRIKNKQVVKDGREYFKGKEIPVEKVANLLLDLLDYAIEIKDDNLITRLSADIQTLLRLTRYKRKE